MFTIVEDKCEELGSVLSEIPMREDAFSHIGPKLEDKKIRSLVFLYVAAICHQTETLKGTLNGEPRRGWDYLMGKFMETGRTNPKLLDPNAVRNLTSQDLQSIVSDSGDASTSTLSRAKERANFLREIAEIFLRDYDGDSTLLYSTGMLNGEDGLYSKMSQFSAFGQDPIMKKATVYFMLMEKSGLWGPFKDPENLRSMPDYHKMRFFLRTGCIKCDDEAVDEKLKTKQPQDIAVDNQLREATTGAYQIILKHSGKDFFELETLLWSFARSFCYHSTLCVTDTGQGNFSEYADIGKVSTCPLLDICKKKVEYWQPNVDTHFH